jgi:hypothetical protein
MANYVWTAILYFCTFRMVYMVYRCFVEDRKAEGIEKTKELIGRSRSDAPQGAIAQNAVTPEMAPRQGPPPAPRFSKPKRGGRKPAIAGRDTVSR